MLKTKECPSCALPVPEEAEECPYCHYEFPRKKTSVKWVALLILAVFVYPLFVLIRRLLAWLFG